MRKLFAKFNFQSTIIGSVTGGDDLSGRISDAYADSLIAAGAVVEHGGKSGADGAREASTDTSSTATVEAPVVAPDADQAPADPVPVDPVVAAAPEAPKKRAGKAAKAEA